jgi:hypothetical protein
VLVKSLSLARIVPDSSEALNLQSIYELGSPVSHECILPALLCNAARPALLCDVNSSMRGRQGDISTEGESDAEQSGNHEFLKGVISCSLPISFDLWRSVLAKRPLIVTKSVTRTVCVGCNSQQETDRLT